MLHSSDSLPISHDDTVDPETRLMTRQRIARALAALSPQERALVDMLQSGMTCVDIAAELGQSVEAVWKRVERMRAKARATEQ